MRILIRDALLADAETTRRGDLLVEGGRIAAIGALGPRPADLVLDGSDRAVIPGLVNAHTHAAMVLFRGFADDMPLRSWLKERIWPLERHLTPEHVYHGTRLACVEMLRSGTTAFLDMYFFSEAAARAAEETGIVGAVSTVFFDVFRKQPLPELVREMEESLRALSGRPNIIPCVGPHAPYTVTLEALAAAAKVAERFDARVHFHLAETEQEVRDFRAQHGEGLVRTLDRIGFLNGRLVAAHGIWLDGDEIRLLAERGVTISHCPASNMKLASGSAARVLPFAAMRDAGLRTALGTDGAASNNNLDMFEAMKLAALLQKHATGDPTVLTAREAFRMATVNGAEALGLDSGLLQEGRRADLVVVDLSRPYLVPGHDLVSDLVYAARGDCVDTVIVGGRIAVRDGRVEGEEEIIRSAREAAKDLIRRAS